MGRGIRALLLRFAHLLKKGSTRRTATGSVAALPASIYRHGQSTLPDGRVIIAGGSDGSATVRTAYIYTPNRNVWEEITPLATNNGNHRQSTFNDGRVMLSGGSADNSGSVPVNPIYIYASDSNTWTSGSSMPVKLAWHGQSILRDDMLLVSGGYSGSHNNTVYTYTVSNNSWNSAASMSNSVSAHGQSTLLNGNVMITGGGTYAGAGLRTTAFSYNPIGTGSWSSVTNITTARDVHGQSTLLDGKVLISGGRTGTGSSTTNTSYIYNYNTNVWTSARPVPASFGWHGQSTLADGRVMVSGGNDGLSTAYIYTPTGWEGFLLLFQP